MDRALEFAPACHRFKILKAECLALLGRYPEAQSVARWASLKSTIRVTAGGMSCLLLFHHLKWMGDTYIKKKKKTLMQMVMGKFAWVYPLFS